MSYETFFIDVWSDVVCPFCYLGSRQLAAALAEFEHADKVVIRHRAFELDRNARASYDRSLAELVAKKYAMPVERVDDMHAKLCEQARSFGMEWHLDIAQATNTFSAHRLIALATSQGLGHPMSERLFQAYFSEGKLVSDPAVLNALAIEVGVTGCEQLWLSEDFVDEVRADEQAATELGISGVPSLLIDEKFMVVGAQGADHILNVLLRAWARRTA